MISRYPVCGCFISSAGIARAAAMLARSSFSSAKYICFANAHTIATAVHNPSFARAVNSAWLNLPSGKPLTVLGNMLYGNATFERAFGADFMAYCLSKSKELDLTHFFYGSTGSICKKLIDKYTPVCDGRILGFISPPFGAVTTQMLDRHFARINSLKPKIIWIALGAPKQELFMHENCCRLHSGCMAGVGAAFEFEAGLIRRAPLWMQQSGLQWLYRLLQDPLRLWRRYLTSNPSFAFHAIKAIISEKLVPAALANSQ